MKKGIYLIGILLVPSVIYLLFSLGEHNMAKLGFYGDYQLSEEGDTVYQSVEMPTLLRYDGEEMLPSDWKGKAVLIHFYHWPCDETCKTRLATLNNYLHKVGMEEEWVLVSACLDETYDDALRELSSKNLYDHNNWHFVHGSDITQLQDELLAPLRNSKQADEQLLQMEDMVVLLDQDQRIRSYFDLRLQQDNKRMGDALKLIIQEPHISWKNQ